MRLKPFNADLDFPSEEGASPPLPARASFPLARLYPPLPQQMVPPTVIRKDSPSSLTTPHPFARQTIQAYP